jgi:hypothetical protein
MEFIKVNVSWKGTQVYYQSTKNKRIICSKFVPFMNYFYVDESCKDLFTSVQHSQSNFMCTVSQSTMIYSVYTKDKPTSSVYKVTYRGLLPSTFRNTMIRRHIKTYETQVSTELRFLQLTGLRIGMVMSEEYMSELSHGRTSRIHCDVYTRRCILLKPVYESRRQRIPDPSHDAIIGYYIHELHMNQEGNAVHTMFHDHRSDTDEKILQDHIEKLAPHIIISMNDFDVSFMKKRGVKMPDCIHMNIHHMFMNFMGDKSYQMFGFLNYQRVIQVHRVQSFLRKNRVVGNDELQSINDLWSWLWISEKLLMFIVYYERMFYFQWNDLCDRRDISQYCVFSGILDLCNKDHIIIPTVLPCEKMSYSGGCVLDIPENPVMWKRGVIYDFSSMYPNIIMKLLLGYMNPHGKNNISSIIGKIFQAFIDLRALVSSSNLILSSFVKLGANKIYGLTGYSKNKYVQYNPMLSETITTNGVALLMAFKSYANMKNHEVCYGHTDSLFFVHNDRIEHDMSVFNETSMVPLKREDIFTRAIFKSKNNYFLFTEDQRVVIKGHLSSVKQPLVVRSTIHDVLYDIMKLYNAPNQSSVQKIIDHHIENMLSHKDMFEWCELWKTDQYRKHSHLVNETTRIGNNIRSHHSEKHAVIQCVHDHKEEYHDYYYAKRYGMNIAHKKIMDHTRDLIQRNIVALFDL